MEISQHGLYKFLPFGKKRNEKNEKVLDHILVYQERIFFFELIKIKGQFFRWKKEVKLHKLKLHIRNTTKIYS